MILSELQVIYYKKKRKRGCFMYLGEDIKKLGFGLMRLPQKNDAIVEMRSGNCKLQNKGRSLKNE